MGLSETIIAAGIGAAATVTTALFQLFGAIRANKNSVAPRRGSTVRSIVAVCALMLASGVGGYMFSEIRQERAAQDLHSMRDELSAKLQVLESTTAKLAQLSEARVTQEQLALGQSKPDVKTLGEKSQDERTAGQQSSVGLLSVVPASGSSSAAVARANEILDTLGATEATLFAPACVSDASCTEANAPVTSLCSTVSKSLPVARVDLFIRTLPSANNASSTEPASEHVEWDRSLVTLDQDAGGAKFIGPIRELPVTGLQKSICVGFSHWSRQDRLARMVVRTKLGDTDVTSASIAGAQVGVQ